MELDTQMVMTLFYILLGLSIANTLMLVLMVSIVSSSKVGKYLTMFALGGPIGYPTEPGGEHSAPHKPSMGYKTERVDHGEE